MGPSEIYTSSLFNIPGVAVAVVQSPPSVICSWFVEISLRRRPALMVGDGAFSHKIDYITILLEILNPKGHQNCITGSRVTAILLNGWTLPIGEAALGRVCSLRSRLVTVALLSD